jgi:L-alanine-DL-glutamate epimerase-like enolase superfamily enzyme
VKITDVCCSVLAVPDCRAEACDSAQDTIVVSVHTDEGITGIGEVDANPWIVKATIEAPGSHIMSLGLRELLIGQDPANRPRSGTASIRLQQCLGGEGQVSARWALLI